MSVSDSELEELQLEPPPIESLDRSGRNRLYLNFMTENSNIITIIMEKQMDIFVD